jgi:hypothetical protein
MVRRLFSGLAARGLAAADRAVRRLGAYGELRSRLGACAELRQAVDQLRQKVDELTAVNQVTQRLLAMQYQQFRAQGAKLPAFRDVEFRSFSQNGEDGILLYLFSLIGTTNKKCVEICAGDGIECNTANLILNHGWTGLLVDGNEGNVARGKQFYAARRDTFLAPPTFVHAWVMAENANSLIRDNGFAGDIDLLSLDVDGIDYWLWRAIDCVRPRVVVLEYHTAWGPDQAVTVPYRPDFRLDFSTHPYYCGASLPAFVTLGRQKGYRLVGCQRNEFNAFFLRAGVGEEFFPEIGAAECLRTNPHDWDWGGREWLAV